MNCPKCKGKMESVDFDSILIDRCTNCKGIWFDILEHEDLKKVKGSDEIDIGNKNIGKEFNKIQQIDCPKCSAKMITMRHSKQNHIQYEKCNICHGIFFDAGEFKDFKKETLIDFFKDL